MEDTGQRYASSCLHHRTGGDRCQWGSCSAVACYTLMFQHEGHQSSTWLVLVRSCDFNLLSLRHTKYWHVSSFHYLFPISNIFKSALLMGFLSESQNFRVYFLPTFSKRSRRTYIGATISICKMYTSKLTVSGLPFTFWYHPHMKNCWCVVCCGSLPTTSKWQESDKGIQ